jgi:hypothetical protein
MRLAVVLCVFLGRVDAFEFAELIVVLVGHAAFRSNSLSHQIVNSGNELASVTPKVFKVTRD